MVQNPHTHQPQCVTELVGDGPIRGTGFRNAAGVVVRENGSAGIDAQRRPHDFSWIDARAIDGATEEFLAVENAMAVIEPPD